MPTTLSDRLKSLTPNSSVLSILEDQPIYGFHRTSLSFNNILEGSGENLSYKFGKGKLKYISDSGDLTINPSKRFSKDGFLFARNPAYDNSNNIWSFPRMYYKPGNTSSGVLDASYQDGSPVYVRADFNEGGYFYEKFKNEEPFSITLGGVVFTNDDFEEATIQVGGFGGTEYQTIRADYDQDGEIGDAGDTFAFQDIVGEDIAETKHVFGEGLQNSTPTAAVSRDFYEMIMQFSAYPSATAFGLNEVISRPDEFSFLMYDAKRDSSFQVKASNLAVIIASIAKIANNAISGDGTINITAPMLSSGQIQNFFTNAATSDLTAEGAVSTEALLEFLTAFGTNLQTLAVQDDIDSQMSYHSGYDSDVAGEGIVLENFAPDSLESNVFETDFSSSFGGNSLFAEPNYIGQCRIVNGIFLDNAYTAEDLGNSEDVKYSDIVLRFQTYEDNSFNAHTSFGGTLGSGAVLATREMPDFNKVVLAASDFDDIVSSTAYPAGPLPDFIYEDIFRSANLYQNVDDMTAFESVSIVQNESDYSDLRPSWHNDFGLYNDFVRLNDRSKGPADYLSSGARLEVSVEGYVTAESGDTPVVALFLRATGTTDQSYDTYPTSDFIYALGRVDMGEGTEWDDSLELNIKHFSFKRDFAEYECFYSESVEQAAKVFPSQTNAGDPVFLGIFASFFNDGQAHGFTITGVKYRYKNESLT